MIQEFIKEVQTIFSSEQVKLDLEDRIAYGIDASRLQGLPSCVVFPESSQQVSEMLQLASRYRIPIYPRGAGSGMVGGSVPIEAGVVVSFERMNRIIEIDENNMFCIVEPGVVTEYLQNIVSKKGLFYPPDPSSLKFSTIGGNVATGAGGPRAVKYGVTKDYVLAIEAVLASGEIIRTGSMAVKSVVGYDLTKLLVGSEGTLALFTKIVLRLITLPAPTSLMLVTFSDARFAARAVSGVLKSNLVPSAIEFMDEFVISAVSEFGSIRLPEDSKSLLIFEIDDIPEVKHLVIKRIEQVCESNKALSIMIAHDDHEKSKIWNLRRSISPALARIRRGKINEDVAVPRNMLPDLLKVVEDISRKYEIPIPVFGHAGDGNLHVNIMYDPADDRERESAKKATRELFTNVLELRGTISGEHGIGVAKSPFIAMELGNELLQLMWRLKLAFDPLNILNPGKIFMPNKAFIG